MTQKKSSRRKKKKDTIYIPSVGDKVFLNPVFLDWHQKKYVNSGILVGKGRVLTIASVDSCSKGYYVSLEGLIFSEEEYKGFYIGENGNFGARSDLEAYAVFIKADDACHCSPSLLSFSEEGFKICMVCNKKRSC